MAKKYKKAKSGLTVAPKYFEYENLPCMDCKEGLMAEYGMPLGPGPRIPGFSNRLLQTLPNMPPLSDGNHPIPGRLPMPGDQGQGGDTSKVVPGQFYDIQANNRVPTIAPDKQGPNFGNAALLGLSAFDALLPNRYNRQTVVQPQMAYNPLNYGLGSQALMEHGGYIPRADYGYVMGEDENNSPSAKNGASMKSKKKSKDGLAPFLEEYLPEAKSGNWIQKAVNPAHKGYCTPMTKSTCTPRRKALAKTFKKHHGFHKSEDGGKYGMGNWNETQRNDAMSMLTADMDIGGFIAPGWDRYKIGGVIPDNMSAFNPHEYEQGGNVNGGAKLREVGAMYPNSDLMEQWLLYANGGPMRDLHESVVRRSDGYAHDRGGDYLYDQRVPLHLQGQQTGITGTKRYGHSYDANIPEPGYSPMNINNRSNYSATFPQGAGQQSTYFPNQGAFDAFINSNPDLLISSQQGQDRGSAALKNRPMKNGGGVNVNGGAKLRDVNAIYPNSDLMEQWLLYRNGGNMDGSRGGPSVNSWYPRYDVNSPMLFENGGQLSAAKAKEMLRDGTANGKKLTAKQKKYFGMVAAGKAAMGTDLPFTGPTSEDPKKKGATNTPKPGERPQDSQINWTSRNLQNSQIDRDALLSDRIAEIIGNNYDPYAGQGRGVLNTISTHYPEYQQDLGVRIKQLQSDPTYGKMTPEQRISRFYDTGRSGMTPLDQFIGRARTLGGNQAAYWQNNAANPYRPGMRNGGVMYEDGGEIETMWGGNANLESYNPYDEGTVKFNGPSHDNGGIGMAYNGSPIEVEGGEYASKDGDGNLNIFGNMYIPGTRTKFKAAAGAIAGKEKRYDYLKSKGADLVNGSNPANRFDQLRFNAGQVMMNGGEMGQQDLASKKDRLANLQRDMLEMASFHGFDPFEMSKGKMKKAKGGASIPFMENGGSDPGGNDPTRADRNMNPGNIKYGKFAQKYGAKKDKDGFAIFKDRATGEKAMRDLLKSDTYNKLPVNEAIRKWTGGNPYRYDLGPLTGKSVGDLNKDEMDIVLSTMQQGEGTRYGMAPRPVPRTPQNTPTPNVPAPGPYSPYTIPNIPLDRPVPGVTPVNPVPPYTQLETQPDKTLPSNVEPLHMNQLMGEIYAAATNRVEPVPAQRYEPQLFTPYQVSFQDRLNANQSVFNAQARAVGAGNPAALGTLGAQKYQADQQVMADEFRTNQAIANDITNKNIALVNDANLKNLGLADTQMTRQSQTRSKTRELNQMILNSISSKYAQNDLENKRLAAYENLYDYRFVPTEDGGQRATYMGPNAYFNYDGKNTYQKPQDVRTISRYDSQGNLKGYADYDESQLREQQRLLDIEKKKRGLPLMPMQPLNK